MKKRSFLRLVGYECRKSFFTPWMLLMIVLLLAVNCWKIHDTYQQKVSKWEAYESVYDSFYAQLSGPITEDKINRLMTVYAPLEEKFQNLTLSYEYDPNAYTYSEGMDEEFFRSLFLIQMKYNYLYQNEAYQIANQAYTLAEFYENAGNSFEAEKNRAIVQAFSGRTIPEFHDARCYEVLMEYDYSAMLVLLLTLFALCGVFVRERETDMYMLLRTTKNGSGRTVAAKLTAAAGFIVLISGVFFGLDFLVIYLADGRGEFLSSPVYAMRAFEATPLNLTVGGYFLFAGCLKTLGVLGCGCVILLMSSLCRQTLAAFFAGFTCLMVGVVGQEFCRTHYALKWCNPMELVIPRELTAMDAFVNILGQPMRVWIFVTLGVAITVGMVIGATLYLNRSYHNRLGRRGRHVSL